MGAVYAAVYAGMGVSTPYIAPWFAAHGLDGAGISAVLAAPMLARLATSPLLAVWADSYRFRRTAIAILAGEITRTLQLLGVASVRELTRSHASLRPPGAG